MKSLTLLAGGSLLYWAALAGAGWLIWRESALVQSATAFLLCLIPALASLAWIAFAAKTPEMQVAAVLGSSGVRMAVVLAGSLGLMQAFPETYPSAFLFWVGAIYLGVLAMEVSLTMKVGAKTGEQGSH